MGDPADPTKHVRTSFRDGIGYVVLDRPKTRNAITMQLATELKTELERLAEVARVLVIRGANGTFCAGGDFHEVRQLQVQGPDALRALFERFHSACMAIAELPVPVVAAVEGYAVAGGFELMQACDIAIVREDAIIADNHLNFAQVPAGGGTQRLPRLVGRQRALGHILTGDRLSGAEAAAWGLAYRAVPATEFESAVDEFVSGLATKDPAALARAKRLIYAGLVRPLSDGLEMELATVLEHLTGDGADAGIDAFMMQRNDT